MSSITTRRLRLAADLFSFAGPSDKRSSVSPTLWLSNDYSIELAFFYGTPASGTMVTDLSNITSMTLEVKALDNSNPPAASATALISETITTFNESCTWANWSADTDQQAVFELSAAQMTQTAGKVWMVISAATAAGKVVTLLAGEITFKEDGYNSAGTPPDTEESAWTKAEADARYARQFASIADLTGGGSGKLDGLVTAGGAYPTRTLVPIVLSGALTWWQLQNGTTAEDTAAGIVRPNDYDGSTNAQIWVRVA